MLEKSSKGYSVIHWRNEKKVVRKYPRDKRKRMLIAWQEKQHKRKKMKVKVLNRKIHIEPVSDQDRPLP
jgi:hypothetical protein